MHHVYILFNTIGSEKPNNIQPIVNTYATTKQTVLGFNTKKEKYLTAWNRQAF